MKSAVRWISVLAVALVWIVVAASIVLALAPLFERMFLQRVSNVDLPTGPSWQAWLLAAALVLGCVTAWGIARAKPLDGESRALRSALSVWPGWPLAIIGIAAAAAALLLEGLSPRAVSMSAVNLLDGYAVATVPLTLAAAAAATGGRSKGAAALLAAPMTLILAVALVAQISIVRLTVAACVPAAALAVGFAALASITGRELLVWLAIGFATVAVVALVLATGLFTPTEVLGVISVLAVAIGLLVHALIDRAFPWRVLTIGATEILAASAALVFGVFAFTVARVYGEPFAAPPGAGLELIAVVAMLVSGFLLTPMLSLIPLLLMLMPRMSGEAGIRVGTLLVLAGVATMVLRSIDWRPRIDNESPLRLSRTTGLVAVAMLLAAVTLTLVFWPAIEIVLRPESAIVLRRAFEILPMLFLD